MEIKTPTSAPAMSLNEIRDLVQKNKDQIIANFNQSRAEFILNRRQLEKMGIVDDYEQGIEVIVAAVGEEGITIADLHSFFPEAKVLKKASEKLAKEHKISVTKAGMTLRLQPYKALPPEPTKTPESA